jgi:transcriptional regulator of arginine metabolism
MLTRQLHLLYKELIHSREYLFIMNKTLRQKAEVDVLRAGTVRNQQVLQKALRRRGFKVGQATLSRDIRELNLIKTAAGYSLGDSNGERHAGLPPASRLLKEFLLEVRAAQNMLILKTIVGSAQPVAVAMDREDWHEVVGTVGGDDTVLVVCHDKDNAKRLAQRIHEMLKQ